jgi:hypothetical protein
MNSVAEPLAVVPLRTKLSPLCRFQIRTDSSPVVIAS